MVQSTCSCLLLTIHFLKAGALFFFLIKKKKDLQKERVQTEHNIVHNITYQQVDFYLQEKDLFASRNY